MTLWGHPAPLEDPQATPGGSEHSLYSPITTGLRQGGDPRLLLSYASLVMAQVHQISLGEQRTAEAALGWTFMCDCISVDSPDVILGLGKAQRHLKQSGLPRLESLE